MLPYGLTVENQEKKLGSLMICCGANSFESFGCENCSRNNLEMQLLGYVQTREGILLLRNLLLTFRNRLKDAFMEHECLIFMSENYGLEHSTSEYFKTTIKYSKTF